MKVSWIDEIDFQFLVDDEMQFRAFIYVLEGCRDLPVHDDALG